MEPIKIWAYENAPAEYQILNSGGDEDYIIFVPNGQELPWCIESALTRCGNMPSTKVDGGIIYLSSHA